MEKRVLTYQDFSDKKFERSSDQENGLSNLDSFSGEAASAKNESHEHQKNYMFFQNLATVKHYIDEVMAMDKSAIDSILTDGHDWASDHLATAKDDVEEVTNFLRNEIQMNQSSMQAPAHDEMAISTDMEGMDMMDQPEEEEEEVQVEIEPADEEGVEFEEEEIEDETDDDDDKENKEEEEFDEE
jgi:hypothetical protein